MKRIKWFVAAAVMGTLFFGCKAKEQTAEAPPPEQPKAAEAPKPQVKEQVKEPVKDEQPKDELSRDQARKF